MLKSWTVLAFTASTALDWFTSLTLLNMGYAEANPFYGLLGDLYWPWYLFVNALILAWLLGWSEIYREHWWWAYLLLWIPTLVHGVCGVHNLSLF